jgi:hypothetical protein
MAEHHLAILMLKVLIQPQARTGLGQDRGERGLAHLQRIAPQVLAVQLDQVEGEAVGQVVAEGNRAALVWRRISRLSRKKPKWCATTLTWTSGGWSCISL